MVKAKERAPVVLVDVPPSLMRGDLIRRLPTSGKFRDKSGQRYGQFVVVGVAGFLEKYVAWLCLCDCGSLFIARSNEFYASNHIRVSCGCQQIKHGLSGTAIQNIWGGIIQRCCNKRDPNYFRYGGRGITICDRWRNSLAIFSADMGPRPSKGHSVDRYPDQSGNYEPGNCRWATALEQSWNSRKVRMIEHNGVTQPLAAWARNIGLTREMMRRRVDTCLKFGIDISEALTTPHGRRMPSMGCNTTEINESGKLLKQRVLQFT